MRLISLALILSMLFTAQIIAAEITSRTESLSVKIATDLDSLTAFIHSGRPTVAYFYYSVACSCAAAQCAIAAAAIDSIPELKSRSGSFNYVAIDAFTESPAESLYNIEAVPAIIGFDKNGKEAGRLEWFIDKGAIEKLIKRMMYMSD